MKTTIALILVLLALSDLSGAQKKEKEKKKADAGGQTRIYGGGSGAGLTHSQFHAGRPGHLGRPGRPFAQGGFNQHTGGFNQHGSGFQNQHGGYNPGFPSQGGYNPGFQNQPAGYNPGFQHQAGGYNPAFPNRPVGYQPGFQQHGAFPHQHGVRPTIGSHQGIGHVGGSHIQPFLQPGAVNLGAIHDKIQKEEFIQYDCRKHRSQSYFGVIANCKEFITLDEIFGSQSVCAEQKPHAGYCPAVRQQCPRFGPGFLPWPKCCSVDSQCAGTSTRCCFDRCLNHKVCKPTVEYPPQY